MGDSFENRASSSGVRDLSTVYIDSVPSLPGFMDFTGMSFPCSHPSIFVRVAASICAVGGPAKHLPLLHSARSLVSQC